MKTEELNEVSLSSNVALDEVVDEPEWQLVNPNLTALRRMDIGDIELTYIEQGKGPLVVLVHGALGDCRTWSRQVAQLSQHYHVISYSRRYHYLNPQPEGPIDYSYERHAEDLISLLRALRLGPAHLVGHSYGATVAALVALDHPEMVNTLTLGEPGLFSFLSEPQDKVSLRLHSIALQVVQKLSENDEPGLAVREYLKIVVGQDVFDGLPLEDTLVINQNAHTLGPMLQTYFDTTALNHRSIQNLATPTLLITGERSPGIYGAVTRELKKDLPTAESVVLPEASHGLQMENPESFGAALMNFFATTKRRRYKQLLR